ncbi:PAS domain-containing sensor histidine kinase [Rhizobium sp. Root274]|uniref:sensor histidine kinase n=1 Tax=unclassified Rhizobium TaxID=2613769 RepID=UPI000713EB63|nr:MULTISPECIES: PAS domain-containing sensor histidine kinase [unclassified Rhizobium]KQW31690.1 PAS domain-containing sensor histidine kinase [Rhizobium sp. Root1240]KRD33230.1 PAS domain-containing sensor histidine kinase [Rhizobium sp. Root274]
MPAQYPFIDVAVHDLIRPRLARGEALVLFSPSLDRVLWCNGAGARFFGQASIYDFLEEGPDRSDVAFRQIDAAARQLLRTGDSRSLMLRITSGFQKLPVTAAVERVEIRAADPVVLLAVPSLSKGRPGLAERAQDLMSGFDDPDTHMAVLDAEGTVVAGSADFARLGVTAATARMLINLVEADADRLVKRPIPTGRGYLPAAIGKISDDPALHLLFAVETILGQMDPSDDFEDDAKADTSEDVAELAGAEATAERDLPVAIAEPVRADDTVELEETEEVGEMEPAAAEQASVSEPFDAVIDAIGAIEEIEPPAEEEMGAEDVIEADPANEPQAPSALEVSDERPTPEVVGPEGDNEVTVEHTADLSSDEPDAFEQYTPAAPQAASPAPAIAAAVAETVSNSSAAPFVFDRSRRATRFVWKIDAEGRFSDVSPEFAQAVGPHAADINGVAFSDLAALFNLDPEGKIGELLKKRDTWSGKTILWPVEGTTLVVPVDLAALPTYTRNRDFDGFRGFGIVRVADAQEDPNATGLTFVPSMTSAAPAASDAIDSREPTREEDLEEFLSELSEGENHPPEDFEEDQLHHLDLDDVDTWVIGGNDDGEEFDTASDVVEEDAIAPVSSDEIAKAPSEPQQPVVTPPSYEPPVLRIMQPPKPSLPEKVVQLEEHRIRSRDNLTPGEQAAFREIARKLDPLGLRARVEESLNPTASAPPALSTAPPTSPSQAAAETPEATAPSAAADKPASVAPPETDAPTGTVTPATPPVDLPVATVLEGLPSRRERSLSAEIVDLMPVALLVHVGDRLIHANPEFFALTGYASLNDLQAVGGLDALIQRQEMDENGEQGGRVVAVCADDRLVPVTARLQSVRFDDASALMLALIAQPGHGAKAPEQKVEPAEAPINPGEVARLKVEVDELRSILETATDGVVILDSDGDIRSMNRAASALFNFDDMETRGKPFVMLFAHESQKSILDYLNGLSGHGVASVLNDGREVIGREASGGFLPLFMTIGRLNSSNGYCAVIRDITQWKRTEEELRNAKRAAETANAHKTDFLARVSHEIRTPLNAIIGFADMMANEHFGPVGHPRYGEYAHDIVRSGRHVLDIVNDLLDISKIEAGEMELDFASVGLNDMVQAAVSIVQPQANSQRVIIRTALSQAVPNVVADGRSIKQIALNILANAIRYTPSGGQIIVSTSYEANGSVTLRIRDTGIGMSRSELEQAMKPFRQVSTGTPRSRGDGTGLGLPLTKAMVDANRAQFAISSTPNEGTLVEVTFPSPRVLAD